MATRLGRATLAGVFVVVAARPLVASAVGPVNGIASFVNCVNGLTRTAVPSRSNSGGAGDQSSVATTAQCLPKGCAVTLTMSTGSAQPACMLGGTQLPRALINCPGTGPGLSFRPSYSFCPMDSAGAGGTVGGDRVEMGQDVPVEPGGAIPAGSMEMADAPFKPTHQFPVFSVPGVFSVVQGFPGSKNCNFCHGNPGKLLQNGLNLQLSAPTYVVFNKNRVIFSDDPGNVNHLPDSAALASQGLKAQTLPEVCSSIQKNQAAIKADLLSRIAAAKNMGVTLAAETNLSIATDLCRALVAKLTPGSSIPAAQALPPSSPSQLATAQSASGYSLVGNGIFAVGTTTSRLNLDMGGSAVEQRPNSVRFVGMGGNLFAYNQLTHTLVHAVALSALQVDRWGGGNFKIAGEGKALVNGRDSNIEFVAVSNDGSVDFEIRDADRGVFLAGGTNKSAGAGIEFKPISP